MTVDTGTTTRRPELSSAKRALLEKRLRGQTGPEVRLPGIQRRMSFGPARLSFAQQRLWFLDQLQPGPLYNVPVAVRLRGDLNQEALAHAINSVVARHDALRTRFIIEDGTPLQTVAEPSPHHLSEIDLRLQPAERRESYLRQLLEREASRPFDLTKDELFRTLLISVDENDHVFFLNQHHIISDAWSLGVFFRELAFFYNNFVTGRSFLTPEPSIQYADYVAWQHEWMESPAMRKQLEYWKSHLAGAPHLLELPTDHARPASQSFRGGRATRLLPKLLGDYVKQLSQAEGTTLFMTLLTAFKVLLHRYTRQDDLVVGSPIAGRNRLETEGLMGFFVNTLPLRTNLGGNPTFREALKRVKQVTLDGYAHQDLPFERMVGELRPDRNPSYSPLVQTMFMVQNEPASLFKLPGLKAEPLHLATETSKFDLTFSVEDRAEGLFLYTEFCADLFTQATMDRMLGHFEMLLEGIAANPDRKIGELPMLTEAERTQLLVKWNHTRTNYPRYKTISQLFEEQVGQTPEATALVFGGKAMTYRELNEQANRLAHFLAKNGVGPGVMVGVCLERSIEMIVALVAILKAGGAYVSLDPAYPKERLKMMLEDARTPILLTETKFEIGNRKSEIGNPTVIYLDKEMRLAAETSNPMVSALSPESPAYVSFTSGSTGRPKGVCVPHRGVVRLVKQTNYASFGRNDVFLQLAPIAFDASTLEIWGALLNGATLAIFPPGAPSLAELGDFIQRNGVTTLWLTAGLFHQMIEENIISLRGVRQLLAGGDVLSVAHVRRAIEQLPGCQLINGYGPTENTTFTCCHRIRNADRRSIPIGRPIANTQVYVLDPYGQPVPVGVPGELFAGGDGLALGYINQPQLTAEKFVGNPFSNETGAKLYRTGDLVRWLPDGTIEFLGRIDTQLKIRGFRVELSEIETALNDHPSIRECAVTAHQNGSVDKKLVAYFVAETPAAAPSATELREHLRQRLPDYMVPAAFVPMPSLPLNANGKVDRKALPKPDLGQLETDKQFIAPRDEVETKLAKIWEEVLGVPRIGVDDHFFELGGHSLMAVRLVSRIEKTLGKKIPVTAVFQSPSVAQLAEVLRGGKSAAGTTSVVEIQPKGTKPPLFFVHGVGGGMFWGYTNLAKHLGPDQPVYAFNSRGTLGQPEFPTIREMAAHYVSDLRKFKPHGPYYIGGYCFGGVVALEMARQLHAQGETVPFVTLVNSIPPNADYDRFRWTPSSLAKFVRNVGYWANYVLRQPPKAQRDFVMWKLRATAKRIGRMFSTRKKLYAFDVHEVVDLSSQPKELHELWETHIRILFAHQP
ncbi:MAG TPA: amino acid adenylation domain-containing protein, partial [Desulfuromonadaceae bacterium]|nr:amino acid adenylation domain-containing protein [Desulfuromonadaceae bacterium]